MVRSLDVVTLPMGTSLAQAAATMASHQVACVPIVDHQQKPVRILTRTDVITKLIASLS